MTKENYAITYCHNRKLSLKDQVKISAKIKCDIVDILNKYDITYVIADGEQVRNLSNEVKNLKQALLDIKEYIEKHLICMKNRECLFSGNINDLFEIFNKALGDSDD